MKISLKYTGMPFHLSINENSFRWMDLLKMLKYSKGDIFNIDGYEFLPYFGLCYIEEYDKWMKHYIPSIGVKDKIILDVGAGCGESAKFFLDNGALKVICIECNEISYSYLKKNSLRNYKIKPYNKFFDVDDLYSFNYDILKMDIEGYEATALYDLIELDKPIVIEAHSNYIINTLSKNGFTIIDMINKTQAIMRKE